MISKIYISSEASLTYVHAMQKYPVHIGVCNLPTHALLLFPYSLFWREGLGSKDCDKIKYVSRQVGK